MRTASMPVWDCRATRPISEHRRGPVGGSRAVEPPAVEAAGFVQAERQLTVVFHLQYERVAHRPGSCSCRAAGNIGVIGGEAA